MIGHGGGGLADFAEMPGEFVYVTGAIEEGVVSVKMKVGELCCHAPILGFGIIPPVEEKQASIPRSSPRSLFVEMGTREGAHRCVENRVD
jgi:hypothetical protein